jgi:hypothetical protein
LEDAHATRTACGVITLHNKRLKVRFVYVLRCNTTQEMA